MYRIFLKTLCLAVVLVSVTACEKSPCEECRKAQEGAEYFENESRVRVSVRTPSATKSSTEDETVIGNSVLYVFDTLTGNLRYSFQAGGGLFDFTVVAGTYDFVVMANSPDSQPLSKEMLLETPMLLSTNRPGHFQMYGSADAVTILGGKELSIDVSRIVSKVDYDITVEWRREEYASREFLVKGAYMTNVAGSYTVGGREVALDPIGYRAWSEGVEVYSAVEGGRRVNRCTSPRYDYFETEGAKPEVVLKGMKK